MRNRTDVYSLDCFQAGDKPTIVVVRGTVLLTTFQPSASSMAEAYVFCGVKNSIPEPTFNSLKRAAPVADAARF